MLDALRRGAGSWFAKGLLFLLILSFGVWGIADVFRGRGQDTVATVGGATISTAEFQRAYQAQLEEIRRRFGARITAEQARQFGLDNQVLGQLIGASVIEQHASKLGLGLSDDVVTGLIRNDPAFRGPDGRFSKATLDSILREAGYSERSYIAARRRDELREQITETLGMAATPPQPLVEVLYRYRDETRTVSSFNVDPAKVTVGTPDDAKLKETYEANKTRFVVPESRKLGLLLLTVDRLAKTLEVPEADIRSAFEQGKGLYQVPERRRIQQIAFPDKAAAEAALAKIRGGQSFSDAAAAAGAKESDVDLGTLQRSQVIDPKIADAAFALEKDKVSDVVEGRFATVLLRVTEIEAGRQKPYEEVRTEIRDRLALDRAADEIQKKHDRIDDLRAGGKPLPEIAAELKQPFVEITVDRTGLTAEGKPALEDVDARPILNAAFEAVIGSDPDAVEVGDAGYAWFRVLAITPERQKPYEDVAADVKTLWTEEERRRLVSELASKLADRASAGEPLEALAKEAGGTVAVTKDFKRFGAQPSLSESAIAQAFITPQGKAATAEAKEGGTRTVLRVDGVTVPTAPSKEEAERLSADLARQMQNDIVVSYVGALQDRFGVNINPAGVRAATGASDTQ